MGHAASLQLWVIQVLAVFVTLFMGKYQELRARNSLFATKMLLVYACNGAPPAAGRYCVAYVASAVTLPAW